MANGVSAPFPLCQGSHVDGQKGEITRGRIPHSHAMHSDSTYSDTIRAGAMQSGATYSDASHSDAIRLNVAPRKLAGGESWPAWCPWLPLAASGGWVCGSRCFVMPTRHPPVGREDRTAGSPPGSRVPASLLRRNRRRDPFLIETDLDWEMRRNCGSGLAGLWSKNEPSDLREPTRSNLIFSRS